MSASTYLWIKAAHLLGLVLWTGGMFSVYWLLRIHSHAPADVKDQLTLMERSMALMMDIAAAVAIGCGLAIAINGQPGFDVSWFKQGKWLHVKLTIVVLLMLPIHGFLRAKVKRFSQNNIAPIPDLVWTLLLLAITAIVIVATTKLDGA